MFLLMSSISILCWIHWCCPFFMYLISYTRNSRTVDTAAANRQTCWPQFPLVQQNYIWCMHYPKEWMCLLDIYNLYFWYPWDCYFDLQMKWRSRSMSSQLWLTVTSNHTELLVALNWINAFLPYLFLYCVFFYKDWIHRGQLCLHIPVVYPEIVVWCLI